MELLILSKVMKYPIEKLIVRNEDLIETFEDEYENLVDESSSDLI